MRVKKSISRGIFRGAYGALAIACAFGSFTACAKDGGEGNEGALTVWSKSSLINVLREKEYGEDFRESLGFTAGGGRGEYVSGQIILSATGSREVKNYTLETSDLKSENGDTIGKEYTDVYNEKYIEVVSSPAAVSTGIGTYADALLPLEKAVEYGENRVEKNCNQGIYLETFLPRAAAAGTYKGAFTLTADGEKYAVPVSLTVYDFEVSQESHLESDWIDNLMGFGETDTSDKMERTYFESIANYRASTHGMMMGAQNADEWLETVRRYTNPNLRDENGEPYLSEKQAYLAQINLPQGYDGQSGGINKTTFDTYVSRLVIASFKDNYDYLKKAGAYMGFIDEPNYNNTWDKVEQVSRAFEKRKADWVGFCENGDLATINEAAGYTGSNAENALNAETFASATDELKTSLQSSLKKIGNYIAMSPSDSYYPKLNREVSGQFCASTGSTMDEYNRYRMQNWSAETSGNWWYAAGSASFGNRIDSQPMEQRLAGWYTYDSGAKGYLIWETAQYQTVTWNPMKKANSYEPCDAYSLALRITNAAGDGFIFYPGKPYEIDGPVGSVRAHQYREASEEYEYFYLLEKLYAAAGYSPKNVLAALFDTLCSREYVTEDSALYETQRREVINLILLAQKGVFITDYSELNGVAKLRAEAADGGQIERVNGAAAENPSLAEISADLKKGDGELSVSCGGVTFTMRVAGGLKELPVADLSVNCGEAEAAEINGAAATLFKFSKSGADTDAGANAENEDFDPYLYFAADKNVISDGTKQLSFTVYNPEDFALRIECWFMGKDDRTTYVCDAVILPKQSGALTLRRLDTVRWGALRTMKGVKLKITAIGAFTGEETAKNYSAYLTFTGVAN